MRIGPRFSFRWRRLGHPPRRGGDIRVAHFFGMHSGNYLELDSFLGSWSSQDGAIVQVLPILDGCAQIEFMEFPNADTSAKIFRVRAFDPDSNRWIQYAIDSRDGGITRMEGNVVSGKLTVTGASAGREMREIRNMGNGRLLWELQTRSRGADWATVQQMELTAE